MKHEFIGYYEPTEQEIRKAWEDGTFAFDANTLLNLYRYSDRTRQDFLSVLKALKPQLFLPHQAGLEYHSNRIVVIEAIEKAYSNLYDSISKNYDDKLVPQLSSFKKHPTINLENIKRLHQDFLTKVKEEIDQQRKLHPDFKTNDDVLDKVTEIFEAALGQAFSKDALTQIYKEGKERYSEKIPPGFKDQDKKANRGDRHLYGDLIIWKELIQFSKDKKKVIVFVTDDNKEDWWRIEGGKTIRAREELIKEFFDLTGTRIIIYTADHFLQEAKKRNLASSINETSISEIKEVRKADEDYLMKFGNLKGEELWDPITDISTYSTKIKNNHFYSDLITENSFIPIERDKQLFRQIYSAMLNYKTQDQDANKNKDEHYPGKEE